MSKRIKLQRGLDIKIEGSSQKVLMPAKESLLYGVKPVDFPGLTPKLLVKVGDRVLAGSPLFQDKLRPDILFTSPVSGIVSLVERSDKRRVMEVVVERSGEEYVDFGREEISSISRDKIISKLLSSGLWPAVRQRPYHVVANPTDEPKAIFISGFDSSPLAPDYNFVMDNSQADLFQSGLDVIAKLTSGTLHLVLNGKETPSKVLSEAKNVEISYFQGPHPAGNVGVQIHHLDPINKGEVVWFVNLQDVIAIGRLFEEGIYKPERVVALAGSEVVATGYYKMLSGASILPLVDGNSKVDNVRYISGNVLTGAKIEKTGYLGYYDSLVTVIPEGNYYEMFGWITPGLDKYSFSRTFMSMVCPKKRFRLDTNLHGGERAFVVTGQYEKVVPMDIYPMQLFKAILAEDVELMEQLGIYEVAEEDFALCEFICPSKVEIQSIIRSGIDMMISEMR